MSRCGSCLQPVQSAARFCPSCGTPQATAAPAEVRRTVTVVFCDLVGSTALGESTDAESVREVVQAYFREMRAALERHAGTVEKFIGDAVMGVFGVPAVHEDDALRAVRAAVDMRAALAAVNEASGPVLDLPLQIRIGVATGEVVYAEPRAPDTFVTGDCVNLAARLQNAAEPGEIRIDQATYRLVRRFSATEPLGPLVVRGKTRPVVAFRLAGLLDAPAGAGAPPDVAMVGRAAELAALVARTAAVASSNRCELALVVGSGGIGKTRLAAELVARLPPGATSLTGRCLSYGEGSPFYAVVEVIRGAAGLAVGDDAATCRRRLAGLLPTAADTEALLEWLTALLDSSAAPAAPEETFWAVRRLLEERAGGRPLVVVLDDLHWSQPGLLSLAEHLVRSSRAPILLVGLTRPELLDEQPGWAPLATAVLTLDPLEDLEAGRLLHGLLGRTAQVPDRVRGQLVTAAEGNPLFLEQMLAMLVDDAVVGTDGRWLAADETVPIRVPPTISALLAARLARLEPAERAVLERAAVIGQVFYRSAVEAMSSPTERPAVGRHLEALVRRRFVAASASDLVGEAAHRFLHAFVRDEAYRGLTKRHRAELHEQFCGWLDDRAEDFAQEPLDITGHHLEQAFLLRRELRLTDAHTADLAVGAAGRLGAAGRRMRYVDPRSAARLLSRAAALLPEGDRRCREFRLDGSDALWANGQQQAARAVLAEVGAGSPAGDEWWAAAVRVRELEMRIRAEAETVVPLVLDEAEALQAILARQADRRTLSRLLRLRADAELTLGHDRKVRGLLEAARAHAEAAGDRGLAADITGSVLGHGYFCSTPATEVIALAEQVIAASGTGLLLAAAHSFLAPLYAMQGRPAAARRSLELARAMLVEIADERRLVGIAYTAAPMHMLLGDPESAAAELAAACASFRARGDDYAYSTVAAMLADVECHRGNYRAAAGWVAASRDAAASNDMVSQLLWRSAYARVLGHTGALAEAAAAAREAVQLAAGSDMPEIRAQVELALAEVLRTAGQADDAARWVTSALRRYEAKGNLVGAARARALLPASVS